MGYSLLIKNALTRFSQNKPLSIGIEGGKIAAIGADLPEKDAEKVIDAGGNLVTESFVNGHLHLCKVYALEMV